AGGAILAACSGTGEAKPEDALIQVYANPAKDEWSDQSWQLRSRPRTCIATPPGTAPFCSTSLAFAAASTVATPRTSTATCARSIRTAGYDSTRCPLAETSAPGRVT